MIQPRPRLAGCLLVPRFPLACELAERPGLRGRPVVLGGGASGPRVAEASPEAVRSGIDPGVSLREAIALCPAVAVIEPQPALYEQAWDGILSALQRVSPVVEDARPGVAYAGLTGVERLYGGRLLPLLLSCAPAELGPRAGVAPGKFPALAAAATARPGEAAVIDPADVAAFLRERPVDLLPLEPEALRRLRLLGIRTLGELAALPRHAVQAQFGAAGAFAWELANGRDDRPVTPAPYIERVAEAMDFGPPLVSRDAILAALEPMLVRALRQPLRGQRFVRAVEVTVTTERGQRWRRAQALKEPSGDRARLWRVIRTLVEYAELPGAAAGLRLELAGLTNESGKQTSLFREGARRQEELEGTLRQLKARYGHCPVGRVVEVEPWSRVPERRMALVDFDP